jgi:hypothetical protein
MYRRLEVKLKANIIRTNLITAFYRSNKNLDSAKVEKRNLAFFKMVEAPGYFVNVNEIPI